MSRISSLLSNSSQLGVFICPYILAAPSISMDVYGYLWISMDIYGYSRFTDLACIAQPIASSPQS